MQTDAPWDKLKTGGQMDYYGLCGALEEGLSGSGFVWARRKRLLPPAHFVNQMLPKPMAPSQCNHSVYEPPPQ
jgi:hypothetical protein